MGVSKSQVICAQKTRWERARRRRPLKLHWKEIESNQKVKNKKKKSRKLIKEKLVTHACTGKSKEETKGEIRKTNRKLGFSRIVKTATLIQRSFTKYQVGECKMDNGS